MTTPKLRAEWFWLDRWFSSSACALPIDARGLYRELLSRAWSMGAKLPANTDMLQRLAGVTTGEWDRLWPLVKQYWTERGGHLVNETQLEVYADALQRKQVRVDRAKKGADARWGKAREEPKECSSNAQASDKHMLKQCPPSPSLSKSLSKTQEPENNLPVATQPRQAEARQNGFAEDVKTVVKHYQTHHPRSRPGDKEKALIRKRLQPPEKWTVAELCQAIDGYHESPHHCGDNDRGTKYLGLSLIFRDSAHVQAGVEFADGNGFAGKEEPRCACKRLLQSDESKATGVCQDCREHGKEHAR